jgi:RNA polymerase-associated protein RTF1
VVFAVFGLAREQTVLNRCGCLEGKKVMADLEHLLLEAAGRTSTNDGKQNNRNPAKRRLEDSDSDDGSDSKYIDDDDSDDAETENRKPSGSRMPLKKRFDSGDKDDDDRGRRDDSDSELSIGSDLYKDDEDREQLGKMSELDRELILAERAEARDNYLMRKRARQNEIRNQQRKETGPPSSRMRSSVKSTRSVKENALSELVARRQKAQDSDMQRKRRDSTGSSRGRDSSPGRKKSHASPSLSLSSSSEEEGSGSSGEESDSDGDGPGSADTPSFEDIRSITIRRSKLAKWFMEPFFEKIIVGCFVRIGIGMSRSGQSTYRLCMVKNVDATDPDKQYKFENRTTYKYLNCFWGSESSAARWQMARVSDSPPLEKEFTDWEREVERSGGRMISRAEVEEKRIALKEINKFVYSAETVKQMLQEKKLASSRPSNVAAEKNRLRREMELAESRHEYSEVERIKARLKDLEVLSLQIKSKNAKALMLAEMNMKNKVENFKNASAIKPVNLNLKAGEAGYDPFTRRWTQSQNYYTTKAKVAENNTGANKEAEATEADGAIVSETADDDGKLVDTEAPVSEDAKVFIMHDFELPISLAGLQNYGGAQGAPLAFMARKQRIEATCGVQVPSNDGRRHSLTLTVNDYKRRRGLL